MSDAITSMVQAGAESALVQTGWAAAVSVSRGSEASERSRGSSNLSRSSAKSISIHSKGGAAEDPCGVRILDPLPPLLSKLTRREVSGQVSQRLAFLWRLLYRLPASLTSQRLMLSRSFMAICGQNSIGLPVEVERRFCPRCGCFVACPGAARTRLRPRPRPRRDRDRLRGCKNELVVTCAVCGGVAFRERGCNGPRPDPAIGKSPSAAGLLSLAHASASAGPLGVRPRTPGAGKSPSVGASRAGEDVDRLAASATPKTPKAKSRFSFLDKLDQQALGPSASSRSAAGLGSGDFIPLSGVRGATAGGSSRSNGSSRGVEGSSVGAKRPLSSISSPPIDAASASVSLDALEKALKKQRKQQQQHFPSSSSPAAASLGPKVQPSQKLVSLGSIKTFLGNK